MTEPDGSLCEHCGVLFDGERMGAKCPSCNVLVPLGATECLECGSDTEPKGEKTKADVEQKEADILYQILKSFPGDDDDEAELRQILENQDGETGSLIDLSEPLRRVVNRRKEKLSLLERMLAQAQDRLTRLRGREGEAEAREREVLREQILDLKRERDDLLDADWGMEEIERIYRNLLLLQGVELEKRDRRYRKRLTDLRRERANERRSDSADEGGGNLQGDAELDAQLRGRDEEIQRLNEDMEALRREIETLKEHWAPKEIAKMLKILDELLDELPDEVVKRFAASDDYTLYDRVFRKYLEEG